MKIGDIVIFGSEESNSAKEHPAIVTHVWTDDMVNLVVFFDFGVPTVKGSVGRYAEGATYYFKSHE